MGIIKFGCIEGIATKQAYPLTRLSKKRNTVPRIPAEAMRDLDTQQKIPLDRMND